MSLPDCFHHFSSSTDGISLPERFTFPFYYEPHPLSILAAEEVKGWLSDRTFDHNFGIDPAARGMIIGKMFGVLVVEAPNGALGFLAAFSGKLANSNRHSGFVPPLFDMLEEGGFFRNGESVLNALNGRIEEMEHAPELLQLNRQLEAETLQSETEISNWKQQIKTGKAQRKKERTVLEQLSPEEREARLEQLRRESVREQYQLKDLTNYWKFRLFNTRLKRDRILDRIQQLKEERRTRSSALQQQLFDQYHFLNGNGQTKSLLSIFQSAGIVQPPAGAGECAAPKLLQYAFQHQLRPIALAEFWWGASPKSEVRKHGQFYPSCRGKCEPILGHMLSETPTDPNPMLVNPALNKELETVYEDDHLLVVNKPHEFLSTPGKTIHDSVATRMKARYPEATGPLIVHRLDMSTSGLMLIAKSMEVYNKLQYQFIKRTVKKRYVAVLQGSPNVDSGTIDLPLRVDLEDRPRQLVCYDHGKTARTEWKVISRTKDTTRVHFFPVTGRTHQLRVHAAHSLGLNSPIVGDDLYGAKADRLHLHAEVLEFTHPVTKKRLCITADADF